MEICIYYSAVGGTCELRNSILKHRASVLQMVSVNLPSGDTYRQQAQELLELSRVTPSHATEQRFKPGSLLCRDRGFMGGFSETIANAQKDCSRFESAAIPSENPENTITR